MIRGPTKKTNNEKKWFCCGGRAYIEAIRPEWDVGSDPKTGIHQNGDMWVWPRGWPKADVGGKWGYARRKKSAVS